MTRAPISLLAAGLVAVAIGYGTVLLGGDATIVGPWCLAVGSTAILTALLWLGARRRGGVAPALGAVVVVVALTTLGGLAFALLASPPAVDGPLLLGLPRVTAVMLLLTGAVPLVALPLAYALLFDRHVMPADT
ncbi:MAG: hypothetical protein WD771_09980 [Gemmatimonadaceae bacterium]